MNIKTFGEVDERSRRQLEACMKAGGAEFGVLCADHHPGYSQPIGGAVAYEGYVSPSGVGYDIGCIRGDARVTGADGSSTPLSATSAERRAICWDGTAVRPIAPSLGAVDRGRADVVRLRLVNGRGLVATPDHEVRTRLGWRAAGNIRPGDAVACLPYVGLRHEVPDGAVPVDDARLPALIRLLGYSCGAGTLSADGNRISFWASGLEDAAAIERDLRVVGFEPRGHERTGSSGSSVDVGSVALHSLLAAMGAPAGQRLWPERALEWLLAAPAWIRALFLSAFASAGATTPRLVGGRIASLAVNQAGDTAHAAAFAGRLLRSLGFEASDPAQSGEGYGARQAWVVQLLGGEAAQLRYFEEVGFCLAVEKRRAAAAVASVAWQRGAAVARREDAWGEARAWRVGGAGAGRAQPRSPRGWSCEPDHSGEIAWVGVASVEPAGREHVYDLATADPAQAFFAEGIVVHNCGNKAVRTDMKAADLVAAGGVERVMSEVRERISFGMGVPARERADHPVLDRIRDASFAPQRKMLDLAAKQLGTVGSGNHYVNLFADEEGAVWVGVHFGSRGFGHKTATGFLAVAQGLPFDEGERKRLGLRVLEGEMDSPPVLLALDSEAGQGYIEAMTLAGEYAYAGRDVVVDKVLEILGAEAVHEVHNHHNFAWLEEHFGRKVWVVRKGCTPARPGQEGFVGASMGEQSVILEGAEAPEARDALYSTVHGAGRVMSRTQAAGKVRRRKRYACNQRDCDRVFEIGGVSAHRGVPKTGICPDHPDASVRKVWIEEQVRPGKVDWPAVKERLRKQGIVLVGGGADEAPEVYKRLPEVLAAHGDSIRVTHTLTPLGVAMAGREVFDPYKD